VIGMPRARARAIQSLARAVCDGRVGFDAARGLDRLVDELVALDGVGAWTAHYIAMRAGGEPDAFPATDLGLLRSAARLGIADDAKTLAERAEAWRPWRAYAAMHLWRGEADAAVTRPDMPTRLETTDVLHVHG
jgi:AraC family transcriptional regulator of adaptative response / DNA-3-methyladenine glycosylase II